MIGWVSSTWTRVITGCVQIMGYLKREITLNLLTVDKQNFVCEVTTGGSIKQWSDFLYKLFLAILVASFWFR